jgi:hypothetical protein
MTAPDVAPKAGGGPLFPFCQLDFAFPLGPADGRYLARGEGERVDVIVMKTLGAPPKHLLRRRAKPRGLPVGDDEPEPVPIVRATVVSARAFDDVAAAREWLERCRRTEDARAAAVGGALLVLNHAVRAHRLASGDPYVREVSSEDARAVRLGYGGGEVVAEGRWEEAYALPVQARRTGRRRMLAPQEQLAAILSGRRPALASEDLLLRARLDLDHGRPWQAALQLKAAVEAMRGELGAEGDGVDAESLRAALERAAAAAVAATEAAPGGAGAGLQEALAEVERIVRRRRHRER